MEEPIRCPAPDIQDQAPSDDEWIPVSTALPPYEKRVFLTVKKYQTGDLVFQAGDRIVTVGMRHSTGKRGEVWKDPRDMVIDWGKVIAWQPMPAPYEGAVK